MGFLSVLSMAHHLVAERTSAGDTVIDATAGTGVDTMKLATLVGSQGCVYAFDIQQEALDRTEARLNALEAQELLPELHLILSDHAHMASYIAPDRMATGLAAVMFNLGYLPGGDPSVITLPSSTISALQAAFHMLRIGGIMTCVLYPGHEGGATEAAAVEEWAASLASSLGQVILYRQPQRSSAPYLIAIERRRDKSDRREIE